MPVLSLNSVTHDLKLIEIRFIRSLANMWDFAVAKKENKYLLWKIEKFKWFIYSQVTILGVNICHVQKLVFLFEFSVLHEKLYHVGTVSLKKCYSSLNIAGIPEEDREMFLNELSDR